LVDSLVHGTSDHFDELFIGCRLSDIFGNIDRLGRLIITWKYIFIVEVYQKHIQLTIIRILLLLKNMF